MANKEKEEVKKKSTLVHDTICLFMITLISGLLLGAGYTITKKPVSYTHLKKPLVLSPQKIIFCILNGQSRLIFVCALREYDNNTETFTKLGTAWRIM